MPLGYMRFKKTNEKGWHLFKFNQNYYMIIKYKCKIIQSILYSVFSIPHSRMGGGVEHSNISPLVTNGLKNITFIDVKSQGF